MRLWDDEGGSLVLFMAIVFPVLVLFFGVLFDVVRVKYAMNVVNEGVYSSVDSVLADYDKDLYGRYGLFALKGKEYGLDFSSMVRNNVKGKGVTLKNFSLILEQPLSDSRILKKQILEEMKVRGLVNLGKQVYGIFSAMEEVDKLGADFGDFGGSKEAATKRMQERVASNVEVIKGLEERRAGGEAGLDASIEKLYGENRSLLVMAEDLSNTDGGSGSSDGASDSEQIGEDTWKKLGELFGGELGSYEKELKSPGFLFFRAKEVGGGLKNRLGAGLEGLRDDLLLGEYVLERFSNLSSVVGDVGSGGSVGGSIGEAERIIGNGSTIGTLFNILLFRTFVDGVGYFVLDAKAPPELVSRLVYSVVLGLGTGVSDVLSLVGVNDARVPVVNVYGTPNPLEFLKLSYRDHLLMFSLLAGEECLLKGIYGEVIRDFPGAYFCGARGSVKGSLGLTFLKFLPEGTRLFGGEIRGGCFVFEEVVSLSFN
ncbi:MAG: hypothetical protein FD141_657 [Fusobacteria bacterium]|nr:MAG: hypothetical protein FD141_657 [Fusobacteriota bacterium]KAF0228677.1 MAG: hypothetical protein FD182_933 [Fusobacteriota bacterium]